ncbi:MAG TPA: hypothetical protein VFT50_09430 [Baekduia sp.]|nr:hypothetical protein [Baekduia sp.]
MAPTTTVPRNDLQRVLDACSTGRVAVTFLDEGVRLADCRPGGLAHTILRPADEDSVSLPAPGVDVEQLRGTESAAPVVPPAAPDPDEAEAEAELQGQAQAPVPPVPPAEPTTQPPPGFVFTTSSPDVVAPAPAPSPVPPAAPDATGQADPAS